MKRACCAVGRDRPCAYDSPAGLLLDHLPGRSDMCVHEAKEVNADLIFNKPMDGGDRRLIN